jgi:hypothetical protein
MWTLWIDNSDGSGHSTCYITVYDKITGAGTATQVGATEFLNAAGSALNWMAAVTFTQSSLTVVINPANASHTENVTVSCNLTFYPTGLSFGGNVGPYYSTVTSVAISVTSLGFWNNFAVYGIAVTPGLLSPARLAAHFTAGLSAFTADADTWRIARIAGYSGFVPPLGMRGTDLAAPYDIVTSATDTSGQVVSDYFTNIAQSTLALMFTDGPGTIIYRRRQEAGDRAVPQYATGEQGAALLNQNTSFYPTTSPWVAQNSATLTAGSLSAPAIIFLQAGLFAGNGTAANPQIAYGNTGSVNGVAVTPGDWYNLSLWVVSLQGYTTPGVSVILQFYTSGLSLLQTTTVGPQPCPASGVTFFTTGQVQAPATAAWAAFIVQATGTPPSTTGFYVTNVLFTAVNVTTAGGNGATAPEAPFLTDVKLSSDRAQLYNQAILTQYGTNVVSTFVGTSVDFGPSSGIIVNIQNVPSVNARGAVPYTATIYLSNTAQSPSYVLDEGSMEDFGNWITQTLGSPLFRPLTVTITPAATPAALSTGLLSEIGDTFTFRRRHLNNPEVQIFTYCSKLTHTIDVSAGQWQTSYELSPFPDGSVLACDDVIHGTLTGQNLLSW